MDILFHGVISYATRLIRERRLPARLGRLPGMSAVTRTEEKNSGSGHAMTATAVEPDAGSPLTRHETMSMPEKNGFAVETLRTLHPNLDSRQA